MSWEVKLPPSGAFQRTLCCRPLWRIWLLLWAHGLSPQGLVPGNSHRWWLCSSPLGWGKSSTCRLPSWGTWKSWPQGVGSVCFGDDSLMHHLSQLFLDLLLVLNGNFLSSMLYWKDCRVCFDVIFSQHITYTIEAVGEQCLKIPGTVDGCRSRLHIEGWSFTGCAVFAFWGSEITQLTSLTGTMYLGLSLWTLFSRVLKWVNFWDPSFLVLKEPIICSLCEPQVLKESKCGSFFDTFGGWAWSRLLPVFFVRGLERSLRLCICGHGLKRFWWMVFKGLRFTSLHPLS